jgi:hypothetical protein
MHGTNAVPACVIPAHIAEPDCNQSSSGRFVVVRGMQLLLAYLGARMEELGFGK